MFETKQLSSGKVYIQTLTRHDYNDNIHINNLATDIFKNFPDFNETIYIIENAKPTEGHTLVELINEYTATVEDTQYLFTFAGPLNDRIDVTGTIEDALKAIAEQSVELFDANFYNIIFNRKMAHIFGDSSVFMYNNAASKSFIENNTGDVTSGKAINRVITTKPSND